MRQVGQDRSTVKFKVIYVDNLISFTKYCAERIYMQTLSNLSHLKVCSCVFGLQPSKVLLFLLT